MRALSNAASLRKTAAAHPQHPFGMRAPPPPGQGAAQDAGGAEEAEDRAGGAGQG